MSIIHEALKKVQRSLRKNPQKVDNSIMVPGIEPPPEQVSPENNANGILILCISLVLIGTLGFLFIQFAPKYLPALKPALHRVNAFFAKPLPLDRKTNSPTPQTKNPTSSIQSNAFNIEGVMRNGNSTVALINGKIAVKGDTVNGVKILNITNDFVMILKDGKEETVSVRR